MFKKPNKITSFVNKKVNILKKLYPIQYCETYCLIK